MLSGKRGMPKVAGKIEMAERDAEYDCGDKIRVVRNRSGRLYSVMAAIAVIVASLLLIIAVVRLAFWSRDGGVGTSSQTNFSNREDFMRLYEDMWKFRAANRYGLITNAMMAQLSLQQLHAAKAAGLLPLENESLPFADVPPWILPDAADTPASGFQGMWRDEKCRIRCEKQDVSIPPLVVISLDGFANEYLQRGLVPSLDAMAECGARAKFMFPSYPSKTFPNHYTIATGLYPESHGVVDNVVYDPHISPKLVDMKRSNLSGLYLGEPIWSLAIRQHRRMFCLFWPGCSHNITGYNPTIDIKYNKSMLYSQRVDLILDWLLLPPVERPSLIMAYFDQPDTVGHFHTSDRQVDLELTYIESVLHYLFTSLHSQGILDCTNVVVLSDHGMQFLNERVYVDQLLNIKGMLVANGVIGRIYMANSTSSVESVIEQLQCRDNSHYSVYDRRRIPKRYHFAKTNRVGDVIFNGQPGTIFFPTKANDYNVMSDHGYDYLTKSMHAIFFARGPNIRPGTVLEPFQNVELFNVFADLLRLDNDVPTNGTRGLLDELYTNMHIRESSPPPTDATKPAPECKTTLSPPERNVLRSCVTSSECQAATGKANVWLNGCEKGRPATATPGMFYVGESSDSCFVGLCSKTVLVPPGYDMAFVGKSAALHEMLIDNGARRMRARRDATPPPLAGCFEFDARYDADCTNWTSMVEEKRDSSLVWQSLGATADEELADLNRLQFLMYKSFQKGPFMYLQNLTQQYIRRYKRMIAITGTAYDFDNNGLADDEATFWRHQTAGTELRPTHIFRVLLRCADGLWHISGMNCRNAVATRLIAFVLPNEKEELNCLTPDDYLLTNTARIRDIELLTGVHFFGERLWFPKRDALTWRLNITTSLWAY